MNIALILSGGAGSRLGSDIPKQYIVVNQKMIISYCLEVFINHTQIDGIWIVADKIWRKKIIDNLSLQNVSTLKIMGFSNPGQTRQLSILNGLLDIKNHLTINNDDALDFIDSVSNDSPNDPAVIIHDAARPNLSAAFLSSCIEALKNHDGVMPSLPMKDTLYLSEDGHTISGLLDRSKVLAGQSPEIYYLEKYLEANLRLLPVKIKSINGSTEPAILSNLDVITIPGDENNYKITTAFDLERFIKSIM